MRGKQNGWYLLSQSSHNSSGKPQINGWFVGCIHVEEAVIYGVKKLEPTHNFDNSSGGIIILEEMLVQIGFIMAQMLLQTAVIAQW